MFKKKVPIELIENFDLNSKYTPDAVELEAREMVPLFICNEMQQGHARSGILSNAIFHMVGFTVDRTYRMWKTLKGEAIVLEEPDPTWMTGYRPSRIKGELYFVNGSEFKYIDKYMQNGLECQRSHVRLLLPRTEYHKSYPESRHSTENWHARFQSAFMYVGIRDYWDSIIDLQHFKLITPREGARVLSYYSYEPEDAEQ